jgi:hypothetical protein
MIKDSGEHKNAWHAVGWVALWSTVLTRFIDAWPSIDASLLRPVAFAAIGTVVILVYCKCKGYDARFWGSQSGRIAAFTALAIILIPLVLRKIYFAPL